MASATTSPSQDCCCLVHRAFTMFGDPLFRRAESDGAPVMVVHLGEKEAAIPLVALKREFGIEDASDDGRMLDLVVQALDFIAGLRIGDPLPPEVLSGQGELGAGRRPSADCQCATAMAAGDVAELWYRRRC
jgi:hypothetical protein